MTAPQSGRADPGTGMTARSGIIAHKSSSSVLGAGITPWRGRFTPGAVITTSEHFWYFQGLSFHSEDCHFSASVIYLGPESVIPLWAVSPFHIFVVTFVFQ